jgi:chemotaxis methyl-accepting protein methylase
LRLLRARTPAEARRLLEENPALTGPALSAMLVGVTTFFRDPDVFAVLAERVLPELARGRAGLHVWSAGCADGAELYSVALLLAERGLLGGSCLLGTDCRPDALARARAGVFEAAAMHNVPLRLLGRYFTPEGATWQVTPSLRARLCWRGGDLLKAPEPGVWDVILCRNTAMYMRAEAVQPLWGRLEAALRPGGVLMLGKAERPFGSKRLSLVAPCLYRRNRG